MVSKGSWWGACSRVAGRLRAAGSAAGGGGRRGRLRAAGSALAGLWRRWRIPMAQVQSGRGRFERLGVIWWASWTFWTIGKRFLSPNRLKRPFLSPKRRKRPSRARICTPNRRFRPRPPRLYSQSSKTSMGRGGPDCGPGRFAKQKTPDRKPGINLASSPGYRPTVSGLPFGAPGRQGPRSEFDRQV